MDMYTDVIIIVAALSVWLMQKEIQGIVPSINADADEEICSFEEQERLSGMSCLEDITNEKGKLILVSKRMRQIQEKKQKE